MSNDTQLCALLPMKASSERVPGKNIRPFAGKPLYCHIIETIERCEKIDRIIINTDSDAIARAAVKNFSKVQINCRPSHLCGDLVPMNDIIGHDIASVSDEHFIQTHSTNPLLSMVTLNEAVESYFSSLNRHDSLFSVTRYQSRFYWHDGTPANHDPNKLIRTQDLPPLYEENSNLYLFSRSSFVNAGNKRIGLTPQMFEMNRIEAVDIDEPEDWNLAEVLFKIREKE